MEEDNGIDNTHAIPLNSIRRIMERHCPYHISNEAVLTLRGLLEDIASKVTIDAVKKFEEMNECREKQGLRRLKRLNAWAVRNSNFFINFISELKLKNKGFQSEGIVIPGSDNMSAQTIAAKPDNKTTDDMMEVV